MRAAALLLLLPALCAGTATKKGVVSLDAFTFDKVIESQPAVIVKFDVEYPYGDKEDDWKKFAARAGKLKQKAGFLVAEVGVQDYGDDKYNERLRDRYGIKSDDYPAVRLFRGSAKEPAARFGGTFDEKGLAEWAKEKLGADLGEVKREEKKKTDDGDSGESGGEDEDSSAGGDRGDKPKYITVGSEEMQFLAGTYTLLEAEHNSEPVWGLEDLRIFANNQGTWMLSDESNQEKEQGYVYSKLERGDKWPSSHDEWLFYDGEKKEWVDCGNTTVKESGPPPPPGLGDMLPDMRTCALIGSACLFLLSGILFFCGGKD